MFNNALKSDDFPTFGRPAIATLIPCLKMSEDFAFVNIFSISLIYSSNLLIRYE